MKVKSFLFGLMVGFVLMILIPFLMATLNNWLLLPVIDSVQLKIIGAVLAGLGISTFLLNTFSFKRYGKGTPVPIQPPKELVAVGLYKYVRNSMYLGYFGIVFGEYFIFGHLLLLFYAVVFVILTHLFVIYIEEPGLKKRFGNKYEQYLKSVPRWIPKLSDSPKQGKPWGFIG